MSTGGALWRQRSAFDGRRLSSGGWLIAAAAVRVVAVVAFRTSSGGCCGMHSCGLRCRSPPVATIFPQPCGLLLLQPQVLREQRPRRPAMADWGDVFDHRKPMHRPHAYRRDLDHSPLRWALLHFFHSLAVLLKIPERGMGLHSEEPGSSRSTGASMHLGPSAGAWGP